MNAVNFIKMHGLGNDFVILDARSRPLDLGPEGARAIADRRTGVGCDQVLVIGPPESGLADAHMRIYNADGGEAAACGNGARCVAAMVMEEKGSTHVIIETAAGLLDCEAAGDGMISVDMGPAALDWRDIPLAEPTDTLHLGIENGQLKDPVAVSMGNPHAVFFVDDADAITLETSGPVLERHPLFPEHTNVEAAEVRPSGDIRLRVWERGVGITRACGSGACATLVAANLRGLTGRAADVELDGGRLAIEWLPDNHVLMTGPVARTFSGILDPALLA